LHYDSLISTIFSAEWREFFSFFKAESKTDAFAAAFSNANFNPKELASLLNRLIENPSEEIAELSTLGLTFEFGDKVTLTS